MKKQAVIATLSGILALSAFMAGCSSDSDKASDATNSPAPGITSSPTASNAPSASPSEDPKYKFPISGATLSIGAADNKVGNKSYKDNLPVWQQVEKKTGVKIDWQVQDSAQYTTSMPILMASGGKLPDIFSVVGDVQGAAENGLIIPIDGLIEKYAPNIKKFLNDNPDSAKRMKAPDGKIYVLPSDVGGANMYDPYGIIINKTWLDKVKLQVPTTLDEWYTVLKAFKEKDPNGNGKADEIPLAPGSKSTAMNVFGNAFHLHLQGSTAFYPNSSGKLVFEYLLPANKEFTAWVYKMYKEGLIDQEFITTKVDPNTLAAQNVLGAKIGQLNHVTALEAASEKAGFPNKYVMAPPPKPLDGSKPYYELGNPISGSFGISKDAKDPVLAIKWLDYVYGTDEGVRLMNMGVEGTSYTLVNGEPKYTDFALKNPEGLDITSVVRTLGGRPSLPHVVPGKYFKETLTYPGLLAQQQTIEPYLIPSVGFAGLSKDESDAVFKYQPDINTYVNAQIAKYMTGAEPLDGWDKFVEKVNGMGVDKLMAARQGQYDRYMKK